MTDPPSVLPLYQVVLMVSSFLIEPMCRRLGPRLVWALSNFAVCLCMAATTIISLLSLDEYSKGVQHVIEGNGAYKVAALVLFALLGFPLSVSTHLLCPMIPSREGSSASSPENLCYCRSRTVFRTP